MSGIKEFLSRRKVALQLCVAVVVISFFLFRDLMFLADPHTAGKEDRLNTCALKYADEMSALFDGAGVNVRKYILERMVVELDPPLSTSSNIVLNIGPPSSGTRTLFLAASMLNITGRDANLVSANCTLRTTQKGSYLNAHIPDWRLFDERGSIFGTNHSPTIWWGDTPVPEIWWKFLHQYPNVKIVMTDMNATEWYQSRLGKYCNNTDASPDVSWYLVRQGCTPPLPFQFYPRDYESLHIFSLMRLSNIDLKKNMRMWIAYRKLVHCAVPPEQLYWVNIKKQQKNVLLFWQRLVDFLDVKLSESVLNSLVNTGIPYLGSKGCKIGDNECDYSLILADDPERKIINSICDKNVHISESEPLINLSKSSTEAAAIVPASKSARLNLGTVQMAKCARKYAREVKTIVDPSPPGTSSFDIEKFIIAELTNDVALGRHTPTNIVLNAGPRSSGTRGLYTAMTSLNVTARHYNLVSAQCTMRIHKKGTSQSSYIPDFTLFNNKGDIYHHGYHTVWWGDIPVPEIWWRGIQEYPLARITMTDTDATAWYIARMQTACSQKPLSEDVVWRLAWQGCTAPVPFAFAVKNNDTLTAFNLLRLTQITTAQNQKLWDAYRSLVRCAVPPKQLYWVDMFQKQAENNPSAFWSELSRFLDITLSDEEFNTLSDNGIPYVTADTCRMGSNECDFHKIKGSDPERVVKGNICGKKPERESSVSALIDLGPKIHSKDLLLSPKKSSAGNNDMITKQSKETIFNNLESARTLERKPRSKPAPGRSVLNNVMDQCALDYAETVGSIFRIPDFNVVDYILDKLLVDYPIIPHLPVQPYLNVGPGSSGTRSLFLAVIQLNITARHFNIVGGNCTLRTIKRATPPNGYIPDWKLYNEEYLVFKQYEHKKVWWGDIPVPEMWWKFMREFPTTRIAMTDMDSTKWYNTRLERYCNKTGLSAKQAKGIAWQSCTSPVPFKFDVSDNTDDLVVFNSMRLTEISLAQNAKMWEAYRQLVRCAIPPSQLYWVDISSQTKDSAGEFWRELSYFLGVKVEKNFLDYLTRLGVPYMGSKGCRIGPSSCDYNRIMADNPERKVIHSLCRHPIPASIR